MEEAQPDKPANVATPAPAPRRDIYAPSTRIRPPAQRQLQAYAFDPSRGERLGNSMSVSIEYERLWPGPIGSRLAVIDYDGVHDITYLPVDLDDPMLLIRGGLSPSEVDPRFHQQMVFAVASETLERFQAALGRRVHWRGPTDKDGKRIYDKPNRLHLHPHAFYDANAFYSAQDHAIMFGYFRAGETEQGENLPGQTVFTCLSHDIVAHETTHAIVDGIRAHFMEPTNIDVPAFHEAFADLAALFRHFSHTDLLIDVLKRTGGALFHNRMEPDQNIGEPVKPDDSPTIQRQIPQNNPLIELATQFGQASGLHGGLRSALGVKADARAIKTTREPHERGAILVAAVFDAFFTVYLVQAEPLLKLGRAAAGDAADLPQALIELLAERVSRTAEKFFRLCARSLDYCPPVDLTFGDFLRALITADMDFYPVDEIGLRDALMQAFRLRGIVAESASYFSEHGLCWPELEPNALPAVRGLRFGDPNGLTREEQDHNGRILRAWAASNAQALGFQDGAAIEVPSFHPMFRTAQSGELKIDMVVELVQTRTVSLYPSGSPVPGEAPLATFQARSGVTLIIAKPPIYAGVRQPPYVRFAIAKHLDAEGEQRQRVALIANPAACNDGHGNFTIDFGLVHRGD
jgi:hypothetical protein